MKMDTPSELLPMYRRKDSHQLGDDLELKRRFGWRSIGRAVFLALVIVAFGGVVGFIVGLVWLLR